MPSRFQRSSSFQKVLLFDFSLLSAPVITLLFNLCVLQREFDVTLEQSIRQILFFPSLLLGTLETKSVVICPRSQRLLGVSRAETAAKTICLESLIPFTEILFIFFLCVTIPSVLHTNPISFRKRILRDLLSLTWMPIYLPQAQFLFPCCVVSC